MKQLGAEGNPRDAFVGRQRFRDGGEPDLKDLELWSMGFHAFGAREHGIR